MNLRGRDFTFSELELIKNTISQNLTLSRRKLSILICKQLNWIQPNGKMKDRACRNVLLHLNHKGIIQLPKPRYKLEKQKITIKSVDFFEPKEEIYGNLNNFDIKTLRFYLKNNAFQRKI